MGTILDALATIVLLAVLGWLVFLYLTLMVFVVIFFAIIFSIWWLVEGRHE